MAKETFCGAQVRHPTKDPTQLVPFYGLFSFSASGNQLYPLFKAYLSIFDEVLWLKRLFVCLRFVHPQWKSLLAGFWVHKILKPSYVSLA